MRRAFILAFLWLPVWLAADDGAATRAAVAAMQRGDFAAAEKALRAALPANPGDAAVLSLLGVALDRQNRLREADEFHRRALAQAPRSIDVLGNYGNHLAAAGDEEGAKKAYLEITSIDPGNANANLQLARQALRQADASLALNYLGRMPAAQREVAERDPSLSFSLGIALANAGRFAEAEACFARVLAASPADFNALYNLAAVASQAGHYVRARDALETALRQQPENVDVLYRLAAAHYALKQPEPAIRLLAQAARIAPSRADIQKLLAVTTGSVGALDDATAAWNRYLELAPGDDTARRERGHTAVQMGRVDEGLADLRWFLARHPGDPAALYEIGVAEGQTDPARALVDFDQSLASKPDFAPALSARGGLHYQMGRPEAAVGDLEAASRLQPGDALTLDRLGQTYAALDRFADAVRVLRKAAELAPRDSKIQLHFARALADAGQTEESKVVMDRFRQLGPASKSGVPAGLVAYLSLPPEERRADYRARVEKAVKEHPDDASAQVDYLKLLLEDRKVAEAVAAVHRFAALKPRVELRADAGRALIAANQYALAKELLEPAGASADLAIANLHLLDGAGRLDEVIRSAAESNETSSDFYWHAASILLRHGRTADALRVMQRAAKALPGDDEILLMRSVLLELAGSRQEAQQEMLVISGRRPEWGAVWAARKATGQELRTLIETKPPGAW